MRPLLRILQKGATAVAGTSLPLASGSSASIRVSCRSFAFTLTIFDSDRLYTRKHEWLALAGDGAAVGTVGVSHFAQESLGDVVYVETPDVGVTVTLGEPTGTVESVKAVSDIYAPVSGMVVAVNEELTAKPFLINKSTYDKGWIYKVELSDKTELKDLLDEQAYEAFCKEEQEGQE